MAVLPAKNIVDLKKRVGRFLASERYARQEVKAVIDVVSHLGDIAIFGGAIRDIGLRGNEHFPSDVDMVIATEDVQALQQALKNFRTTTNKFGGYRLVLNKWKVDLWPLHLTWAFREGYVRGTEFRDLPRTTFFDWDAVVYEVSTGSIHAVDGYIEKLRSRILDLNFEPNPNPLGATVRILRFCIGGKGMLSPKLTNYLRNRLEKEEAWLLINAEKKGFDKPILTEQSILEIKRNVENHIADKQDQPFGKEIEQLSLL